MAVIRQVVSDGTTAKLRVVVETEPPETGRAGAFSLHEAMIDIDGTVTNLIDDEGWTVPVMVERAFKPSGAVSSSVTATPVFASGSGPAGEDAWDITVSSTVGFQVGDHVRAAEQPDDQGQVYVVLQIQDGTSLIVHGKSAGCDVVSGDTLEEVTPTGVYCGTFSFVVNDFLDSGSPDAQLRIIMQTVSVGNAPTFDASEILSWTFDLQLDLGTRSYHAG